MSNLLQRINEAAAALAGPVDDFEARFQAAVQAFQARIGAAREKRETAISQVGRWNELGSAAASRLQALANNPPAPETADYEAFAAWAAELARAREASRAIDDLHTRAQASAELARRNLANVAPDAWQNTLGVLAGELRNERRAIADAAPVDPTSPARPRIARQVEAIDATLARIERYREELGLWR